MIKRRACILLMDSFGIGASHDAESYGDLGANTLGHIYAACQQGLGDRKGLRQGPLNLPFLTKLGLYQALMASSGFNQLDANSLKAPTLGYYGYAVETSLGKDTPSGHWEIAGVPVDYEWGYFPDTQPCFPAKLIEDLVNRAKLPGVLGEKHASGTEIIQELGQEHLETGKPIVYTSGDSVFQIAAHEHYFGLEALYRLCEQARLLVDEYNIGRVIARPFIGEAGSFKRTGNRRDYSLPPPAPTLLEDLNQASRAVIGIGKTSDIFAHKGVTQNIKADGNMALFDATLKALRPAPGGSLVFTNFVDFDSLYGHRRDIAGYAQALEAFDQRLPELMAELKEEDLVIITADHGCDPSFPGSDHTREHIPVLAFGKTTPALNIGKRESFADIGQSVASWLEISPLRHGHSFLTPST